VALKVGTRNQEAFVKAGIAMAAENEASTYPLDDGTQLRVRVLEPPLGDFAGQVEYWWRDIRVPLLTGALAETSLDRFFIGEVDGVYAGSMTYCMPRDTRDLALLEMVWTHPEYRRRGIARILLRHTLADFRAMGGMAIYLCTTNPAAFALYTAEGFRPLIGDGLRYVAPPHDVSSFDQTYFAWAGLARIRPGEWCDIARVSALYNQPGPDWLIKDYPRRVFRDMRYESHYIRVWKPTSEGRGVVLMLENPEHRVVGIASAIALDSYFEQHVAVIDFWSCLAYLDQLPELLELTARQANERGIDNLQAYVAECDTDKRHLLEATGFTETARLRGHLRMGSQRHDLLIYERQFPTKSPPAHSPGSYYGARPDFQSINKPK